VEQVVLAQDPVGHNLAGVLDEPPHNAVDPHPAQQQAADKTMVSTCEGCNMSEPCRHPG
jgi:hypothetical protein